jgi:hypothetical protein
MTARKSNVTDLPKKVHLSLVAEEENPVEVFAFEMPDGEVVELTDPTDLTVEQMSSLKNPLEFLRFTADEEDKPKLLKLRGKQMSRLIKGYFEHYGIPMEEGKDSASPF